MGPDITSNNTVIDASIFTPFFGILILSFTTYLLLPVEVVSGLSRSHGPPGQSLYLFSKITAMFVYVLMWWQIVLGLLQKTNSKLHMILGVGVLILIFTHVFLFITAASIRQGELSVGLLLPSFSNGYYESGMSLGVIALFIILIAIISSLLRNRIQLYWSYGHGLVYFAFGVVTVHGLMIGSDANGGYSSYLMYGAVFSLVVTFIYKKSSF